MPFTPAINFKTVFAFLEILSQHICTVGFIGCKNKQAVVDDNGKEIAQTVIFQNKFNGSSCKISSYSASGVHKNRFCFFRKVKAAVIGNVWVIWQDQDIFFAAANEECGKESN